jgi:restriction endonuclease S subunit
MNPQDLKNSILQLAIQGKILEQREEDGTTKELLQRIEAEKKQLIKEGKIKQEKKLPGITEDEVLFDIPESWEWTRISNIADMYTGNSIPKSVKENKYSKVKDGYDYIGHKAVIDVNEKGTEAAAVTYIGMGTTSMPNSFIADKPFMFVIADNATGTVLFMGKVVDF